jgi:hypothetical protein
MNKYNKIFKARIYFKKAMIKLLENKNKKERIDTLSQNQDVGYVCSLSIFRFSTTARMSLIQKMIWKRVSRNNETEEDRFKLEGERLEILKPGSWWIMNKILQKVTIC